MTDPIGSTARAGISRRSILGFATALSASAVLAPVLSACSGPTGTGSSAASSGGAGADSGILKITLNRNLVSLDNKQNQFDAAVTVQRAVRQALTEIGDDLRPALVLAESFKATAPTEWTVKLRDDIHYSDGSPITVEDVEVALKNYFLVPAGFVASQFPEQPTVTKVDDRTFKLVTKKPAVTLDSLMSNILVTPAAANKAEELQGGIGSGPFVIAESNSGTGTYKLTPNTKYWRTSDATKLTEVDVSYNEDESSRVIALETGQVDVIDTITPESAAHLKTVQGVEIVQNPGTRFTHLFYNFRLPKNHPLSNVQVRQALTYAVDHQTIIDKLMSGQVTSAEGVVPKTLAGFAKTGEYAFDPDKAKAMLASAGASNLELLAIWEESEFAGAAQVMEALVTMLGDVGVKLTLKTIPTGGEILTWRSGNKTGDWEILANGYGNQTGLALTNLQAQYAGTAAKEKTKDTYLGFVVPAISDLLDKAGSTADEAQRNTILGQAQQQIWAQWPALWAWTPNNVLAKRSRVQGLNLRATNAYNLASVTTSA
jgi:ABC-type transport system substrate-binding protein